MARGTCFVAGKVGDATVAVGRFLAPHVQKQGTRLLAGTFGMDDFIAAERMSDALKIAAGTAEGVGTVFSGLETSATILGTNLANNSVKAVEHKYGASAGMVASDAFDTVGNIINVKKNFSYLTPKGFVKSAGKNTGKSILQEFQPKSYMDKNYIAAGSLYPNLSNFAKELNDQSTSKLMPKSG